MCPVPIRPHCKLRSEQSRGAAGGKRLPTFCRWGMPRLLVPAIAIRSLRVLRLQARFPSRVGALHSLLTSGIREVLPGRCGRHGAADEAGVDRTVEEIPATRAATPSAPLRL